MEKLYYGVLPKVAAMALGFFSCHYFTANVIPNNKHVEEGFIAPSELEVRCLDTNGDGLSETLISIGEKDYMLKEVDGEPILILYEK